MTAVPLGEGTETINDEKYKVSSINREGGEIGERAREKKGSETCEADKKGFSERPKHQRCTTLPNFPRIPKTCSCFSPFGVCVVSLLHFIESFATFARNETVNLRLP